MVDPINSIWVASKAAAGTVNAAAKVNGEVMVVEKKVPVEEGNTEREERKRCK